jgi:hypothetical protein
MSTTDPARTRATVRPYAAPAAERYVEGEGWVLFAAVMLGLLATLNLVDGIAAVSTSKFFVGGAKFVISDLHTWGWILIVFGAIQGVTAAGVFLRWKGIRWVGVTFAGLNAIAQLLVMPAYPLWALCMFALDILVMYGLIAHGAATE